jgi:Glycosyl hydrolases family 31
MRRTTLWSFDPLKLCLQYFRVDSSIFSAYRAECSSSVESCPPCDVGVWEMDSYLPKLMVNGILATVAAPGLNSNFRAYPPLPLTQSPPEQILGERTGGNAGEKECDNELVDITRKYAAMHHDLIPYTRSYMFQATRIGMSIIGALGFALPADESVTDTWNEYLYGRDILVAPVTVDKAASREVYLPAGRWMNYDDRKAVYEGKSTITASAPLGDIPQYVREGAIIPRGDIVKLNKNWDANWAPTLRIEIYPARKDSSECVYCTGKSEAKIQVSTDSEGITVRSDDLGTPSTLEVYCDNVKSVKKNGQKLKKGGGYRYDRAIKKLTTSLEGAAKIEIAGGRSLFDTPSPK